MKKLSLIFLVMCIFALLPAQSGKKYALLVGINSYADQQLTNLNTPQKDVAALSKSFDSSWDKIIVLSDDQDAKGNNFPSRNNIMKRVQLLADFAEPTDTVFFFFSGHGVADSENEYLLPADVDTRNVSSTALTVSNIVEPFSNAHIKNVIMAIDACRETIYKTKGLSVVGVAGKTAEQIKPAMIMYSTKPGWYSYEAPDGNMSVFSQFLIKGISGAAGKNNTITAGELVNWLPDAVSNYSLDVGIRQKPVIVVNNDDITKVSLSAPTAASRTAAGIPAAAAPIPTNSPEKWPYFSIEPQSNADGTIKYTITIKSAETADKLSKVRIQIIYTKNADPMLSYVDILYDYSEIPDWTMPDDYVYLKDINNKETYYGFLLTNSKKSGKLYKSPIFFSNLIKLDYAFIRSSSNPTIRFKLVEFKDFLAANGLSIEELEKALAVSNK